MFVEVDSYDNEGRQEKAMEIAQASLANGLDFETIKSLASTL